MTQLHLVYRSYGGENTKNRPHYYSKALALASFARAAAEVGSADVVFLNNGPIEDDYLPLMKAVGRVVDVADEPLGVQESFRFALTMPEREGWSTDDVVSYNEDDYLFHSHAFQALADAVRDLPTVPYFAFHGRLPRPGESAEEARQRYELPDDWTPQPDLVSHDRVWTNVASTTGTFAARIGTLQEDLPIFYQCMRPFRTRYLDHEICLLYQGCVPYRGKQLLLGLPQDFDRSARGVVRTAILVPYRFALNARARRQSEPHLLYVANPNLAAHLEVDYVRDDQDWLALVDEVAQWATDEGFGGLGERIRSRLVTD